MTYAKGLKRWDQPHKLVGKKLASAHPAIARALATTLPTSADLSQWEPPVYDQGPTGSCTAHSSSAAIVIDLAASGKPLSFIPSMRGIYSTSRALEGDWDPPGSNTLGDTGCELADVASALGQYGVYPMGVQVDGRFSDVSAANVADQPELSALEQAATSIIVGEYVVQPDSDMIAACLAANVPVWVGFFCDSAFENLGPNDVAGPPDQSDPSGGGHAVCLKGFQGPKGSRKFRLRNSWGNWCDNGYCWVSEAWVAQIWNAYAFSCNVKAGAA